MAKTPPPKCLIKKLDRALYHAEKIRDMSWEVRVAPLWPFDREQVIKEIKFHIDKLQKLSGDL